jgi:quinol monooxygenase YgiN
MNTNTVAVWVEMEARPGKEAEVEALLKECVAVVQNETDTVAWFAMKLSESKFCIFDTFTGESGRKAHLDGELARTLTAKADELLVNPVCMQQIAIVAAKV